MCHLGGWSSLIARSFFAHLNWWTHPTMLCHFLFRPCFNCTSTASHSYFHSLSINHYMMRNAWLLTIASAFQEATWCARILSELAVPKYQGISWLRNIYMEAFFKTLACITNLSCLLCYLLHTIFADLISINPHALLAWIKMHDKASWTHTDGPHIIWLIHTCPPHMLLLVLGGSSVLVKIYLDTHFEFLKSSLVE